MARFSFLEAPRFTFLDAPPIEGEFIKKDELHPADLREYQRAAILHLLYHNDAMLWLGMGLGKTVVTLTAIVDRMKAGHLKKTIVFGPLRVVHSVWTKEARKWSHTKHLRFSVIHGNPQKRLRALFADADVYLINYENMNWLAEALHTYCISRGEAIPFQMAVYDEVTMLKNSTSLRIAGGTRFKKDDRGNEYAIKVYGWRKLIDLFQFRVGLTGTAASNGYIDLHGQYLAIDGGKRLGEYITPYRDSYFTTGWNGWGYEPTKIGKKFIEQKISDITLEMNTRDYLDLPPVHQSDLLVDLPEKARKHYDELEEELFTALDSGREVELFNRTSLSIKLLQICNGLLYSGGPEEGSPYETMHSAKLEALDEIIEEASGSPVLCAYTFVADSQRIMDKFKKLKPVDLTRTKATATQQVIDRWNEGKVRLLIGHPRSIGHGIDGLQNSGHTVAWYGLTWSWELYRQLNERIDRNGQKHVVKIIRILCANTVDLAVADAIRSKSTTDVDLRAAVQRYRAQLHNAVQLHGS